MRVTSKGQVTIPKDIRRRHDLRAGSEIDFVERGADVLVRRKTGRSPGQGKDDFATYLDRVTGVVDLGMSTDEFMRMMRGE